MRPRTAPCSRRPSRGPLVLTLALASLLAACSGGSSSSSPAAAPASASAGGTATPSASATPAPTPAPTPVPTPTPPPTMAAPLVIQIENSPQARPQSGISQADVVYEYETEGGISRFSTFWFHDPTTQVGPIRSARLATVRLLKQYDGTLIYSGAGAYVESLMANGGFRRYGEGSVAWFRVGSRAAPHNVYTDPSHVAAVRAADGVQRIAYQLWARTASTALPVGGSAGSTFTVPISPYEQPSFAYDGAAGGYTRSEPTGQMTDAATGKPWVIPTVVVMQVRVETAPLVHDVAGAFGVDHFIEGSGPAQILTGGFLWNATYTQGATGPPTFALADGSPAPIAPGQVMIILTRTGSPARVG